jgi:alanyl-tRNA synthetase
MVTVGIPVADLLAIPDYDWGAKYSIEFCGGTHLASSGLAGRLEREREGVMLMMTVCRSYVTLSEIGIAQGVRRVTGVTGTRVVS